TTQRRACAPAWSSTGAQCYRGQVRWRWPAPPSAHRVQSASSRSSSSRAFLRDEAKIDEDGVRKYRRLLTKNNVNEARLHLLTDAMLRKWGIQADLDRASILEAAKHRTSGKRRD